MANKWDKEKEILKKLILTDKLSYEEIGRKYGCTGSNIKKVAQKIGIILHSKRKINPKETFKKVRKYCFNCGKELISHNGSYGKFCNNKCQAEYTHKIAYKKILDGDSSIMRANYSPKLFREDILKEQGGVCAICGIEPVWNDKELVFIIDHIDGHASNNKRENLRCVCPNCDSQLDTYKSKNKCGERSYYRYHKEEEISI